MSGLIGTFGQVLNCLSFSRPECPEVVKHVGLKCTCSSCCEGSPLRGKLQLTRSQCSWQNDAAAAGGSNSAKWDRLWAPIDARPDPGSHQAADLPRFLQELHLPAPQL